MHLGCSLCQINTDRSILFGGCSIALYYAGQLINSLTDLLQGLCLGVGFLQGDL